MKQNLLLLTGFIWTNMIAIAQPSLNSSNFIQIGDVYYAILVDTTGVFSDAVPSIGANQTWDLGTLTTTGARDTSQTVSPSVTPNESSFPTATVVQKDASSTHYEYFNVTASKATVLGLDYPTSAGVIIYSDQMDIMTFPFTFNTTLNDNFASEFTSSGTTYYRTGSVLVSGDAYGTITLPTGTYNNVLRMKVVQDVTDSTDLGGFPLIIPSLITTYNWIASNMSYPVFSVTKNEVGGFMQSTTHSAWYSIGASSGLDDKKDNSFFLSAYPNPVNDASSIFYVLNEYGNVKLTIHNVLGEQVSVLVNENQAPGIHSIKFSKDNLLAGIYFIRVDNNGQIATTKLIVQ